MKTVVIAALLVSTTAFADPPLNPTTTTKTETMTTSGTDTSKKSDDPSCGHTRPPPLPGTGGTGGTSGTGTGSTGTGSIPTL